MRQTLFTLLLISIVISITSCRRNVSMPDIKQYDNQQILSYISANGITGMIRDTIGGDTTGIYYKILQQGTGAVVDYPDSLNFTYTLRSFDGLYSNADTVTDHFSGLQGHIAPPGLQLALHEMAPNKGTKIRLLIPSHLGYGIVGAGSGSKTIVNGRIAGNQCLDYTIYIIPDQAAYDDVVLQNYINLHNLSGYTKVTTGEAAGMYYKVTVAPTGPNVIDINSAVTGYYEGYLMDNTIFTDINAATPVAPATVATPGTFSDLTALTPGFRQGLLMLGHGGGSFSILVPSRLAYGNASQTADAATVPAASCLRFEVQVTGVSNTN
jgi:FKBP-type peptidyl-prolyl cis-trans isomerase FkpA